MDSNELNGQVADVLQRVKNVNLGGDLNPLVGKIIALVEADVSRRLLSDGAVEAACLKFWGEPREGETGRLDLLESRAALKAALTAIGIEPREEGDVRAKVARPE